MAFKQWLAVLLQFVVVSVSYADSASNTINTLLKNTQSIQATFTEDLLDSKGKSLQETQGRMYLQTPGMFRWEATQPSSQLIIANGKRLWVYDKDLEQVTIRTLGSDAGETPALLLSDSHPALENTFQVSYASGSSASLQKFMLVPKDKSSMYAYIQMVFAGNQIREMRMQDHLGHTTVIKFQNVKTNSAISPALFKFTPPKSVDVIDETKKQR